MKLRKLKAGMLNVEVHPDSQSAGAAAAQAVAESLRLLENHAGDLGVVFATGASQLPMLSVLTALPDLPWDRVVGFHLDEYQGISESHPASFRRYLRDRLTNLVSLKAFHEIDGNSSDPDAMCAEYVKKLRASAPQLCLLGIGENGHLAFNDPAEADFEDPLAMKLVTLDALCRQQQLAEGWFRSLDEVPAAAFTLTIPTVLRIPRLIVSVPGHRKAEAVRQSLNEPISRAFPATILRTHPNATLFLDHESAARMGNVYA
jgi:glucosamine-6-phosphate deaminase